MTARELLGAALLTVGIPVSYGFADNNDDEYIIFDMDDGQADSLYSDDEMDCAVLTGTVDLFSRKINRDGGCAAFNKVTAALKSAGLSFSLNSKQTEKQTGLTHWEWAFEYMEDDDGDG